MPLKSQFRARARKMDPAAPFDLDAEVARAYEEYPELKGNTYFIDLATNRIVHPNLSKKTERMIRRRKRVWREASASKKTKGCYFFPKEALGAPFNVVFLYLEKDSINIDAYPPGYSDGQVKRAAFDHELGHALSLRTIKTYDRYREEGLMTETMAENFMMLRQYLRYGDSRKIDAPGLIGHSASEFCNGDQVHANYFAAPAMEKIHALKNAFNFATLTPEWVADMAIKTARLHTPNRFAMKELKSELRDPANPRSLLGLARRTLETHSEEAFKWGSKVLRYRMRNAVLKQDRSGGATVFKRQHWPKMKKQIEEKERLLRMRR